MKRTIYIAFVAALSILASCTKQSVDVNPIVSGSSRSYIFFEPEVCNVVKTKADLYTATTLPSAAGTAFGVIGYYGTTSLFDGIAEVKRNTENGPFDYEGLVAWQDNTTQHHFYAFYPYTSLKDMVTSSANPYLTYTQPTTDAGMIDILTTKRSTAKTSDNNVALTFYHRLWALEVKITNSQATGLDSDDEMVSQPDLTINSVEIYVKDFPEVSYIPLDTDGKITYGNDKITPESPYEMFISALNKTIKNGDTGTYGALLFAPVHTNTFQYKLVINYTDSRGEASNFTYPSSGYKTSSTEFVGGCVYSLTVNKKEDVFVVGTYHDPDGDEEDFEPGDWTEVTVPHTFN